MYKPQTTQQRKFNLLQSAFVVLLLVSTGYILLQSSFFDVQKILVQGNQAVPAAEIEKVSGLHQGANIFKLNLSQTADKIRLLPMIKDVTIKRSFPATVIIAVQERKALVLLPVKDGFIKIDNDGVYLQEGHIAGSALPVLTGFTCTIPGLGKPVQADGLTDALKEVTQLDPSLRQGLSEIHFDGAGNLSIYTLDGVQGRFGSSDDLNEKCQMFIKVLADLKKSGKRIQYIDLSLPKTPVVKYIGG